MIGSLRGSIVATSPGEITLEVAGIGYRISMSAAGAAEASTGRSDAADTFVWIHHHQRDDGEALFGFADREERDTFEVLIGTHGVGPSLALAILSTLDPRALRTAVVTEDLASLCQVPGVGRKTAQRLLVELSSRFDGALVDLRAADLGTPGSTGSGDDLRDALAALGYRADEIAAVVSDVSAEGTTSERLKAALARLSA